MAPTKKWDIDLHKITISEYRELFKPDQPDDAGDGTVGKTVGLTAEQVQALPYDEYQQLVKQFFLKVKEPLADPNSQSGCTSPSNTETPPL